MEENITDKLVVRRMANGELVGAMPTHGIFKWSNVEDLEDFCERHNKTFKVVAATVEQQEEYEEELR